MKFWSGFLFLWLTLPAFARPAIGPSIDFLTLPHPLSISLNVKLENSPFVGYISFGSFRALYQDDFPISMKNVSLGANYHFYNGWFSGLGLGHQKMEIIDGFGGRLSSFFLTPKLGYEFNFNDASWFIRSEVGVQFNFNRQDSASGAESQALNRFGDDSVLHFSLLKVGYYF